MRKGTKLSAKQLAAREDQVLLGVKAGKSIAASARAADVSRGWVANRRKANADFDAAIRLALDDEARVELKPALDWFDKFIDEFIVSGGQKTIAAAAVGKSMLEIMSHLNPTHPLFNQSFHDRLQEAETVVTEVMLDEARRRGMDKSNSMLIQCLQWLDPDRFGDKKTDQLPFQINLNVSAEERALKSINDRVLLVNGSVTDGPGE